MKKKYKVAVVNPANTIGAEIINYLNYLKFPYSEVIALCERNEIGKEVSLGKTEIIISRLIDSYNFENTDLVFFASSEGDLVNNHKKKILNSGATIIDFSHSTAFNDKVKALIPSVNKEEFLLNYHNDNLISLPSAMASQLAIILKPLEKLYKIMRITISTYQAVSNTGERQAMDELYGQTKNIYSNKESRYNFFPKKIAFNVIPAIGTIENGISREEARIINDLKKLIKTDINVSVNTAYVPVFVGNSAYLNIEFEQEFNMNSLYKEINATKNVNLIEERFNNFTPFDVVSQEEVIVSRLKRDSTVKSGISLWTSCDNLRRGSAMVAVEIAQFLVNYDKIRVANDQT